MKTLILFALLFMVGIGYSGEIERLIEFSLENNPGLKSFTRLKEALNHKANFAKSLPNPRIIFSLNNLDTENFFPNRKNPMSSFGFFISQKYTLPIKRERGSGIFAQRSLEVLRRQEIYRKELIRSIKVLYWEFSYSIEMERILKDIDREISSLVKITEEKYRYGKALLSDLILLKVELLRVREGFSQAKRLRGESLERIFALAGGRLDLKGSELQPLPFPKGFDPDKNAKVKLLKESLKVLKLEIERAKVEHYPDIFLSAGYMIRPDIPNLFTFKVGISVPIWKKRKEDLLVLEKREIYNSKLLELKNTELRVRGDFNALKSSYEAFSEILSIIEKEIEEKRKEIEALLLAYRYERTDIREVLRAYKSLWSLEFDRARLIKELNQIVAKAEALQ